MISNSRLRGIKVSFPSTNVFTTNPYMEKVHIKNIYQSWGGESIIQIKERHEDNPYTLRIGLPHFDEQLKHDSIFFIQSYLSFNPITKDIEKREIIPYRNVEKVYIGQSTQERVLTDYKLFVDGNVVAKDYLSSEGQSLIETIATMQQKMQKLELELNQLKVQLKEQTIYK